jgi:hypothetical protein
MHVAVAPSRGDRAGWWRREGLMARLGGMLTQVTRRSLGEADKGLGVFRTGLDRLIVRGRWLTPREASPTPRSMREHAKAEPSKEREYGEKSVASPLVPLP